MQNKQTQMLRGPSSVPSAFESELTQLINRHSLENGSGTPDYLLAGYLVACLDLWNNAVRLRGAWHGPVTDDPT